MGFTDFLRRHKRKLFVAVGLSASVYWIYSYLDEKLRELKQSIIFDKLTREEMEKQFEQNQRDATFTTMALIPTVGAQVVHKYDVEATRHELQTLRSQSSSMGDSMGDSALTSSVHTETSEDAAESSAGQSVGASNTIETTSGLGNSSYVNTGLSKAELWNQIKVQSLTRAFLLIYIDALLVLFTRIQLNILGRRSYADTITNALNHQRGTASNEVLLGDEEENDELSTRYLTLSWWILHKGWEVLASRVQQSVETVLADVQPPQKFSYDSLNQLFGEIHKNVDENTENFLNVLLPPPELYTYVLSQIPGNEVEVVEGSLADLIEETKDVINSANCMEVVKRLVHSGLSVFMNKVHNSYEDDESEIRLALVLMLAAKQGHQMATGSPLPNEYVENMVENVPELDALCAKIYSNFEIPH